MKWSSKNNCLNIKIIGRKRKEGLLICFKSIVRVNRFGIVRRILLFWRRKLSNHPYNLKKNSNFSACPYLMYLCLLSRRRSLMDCSLRSLWGKPGRKKNYSWIWLQAPLFHLLLTRIEKIASLTNWPIWRKVDRRRSSDTSSKSREESGIGRCSTTAGN